MLAKKRPSVRLSPASSVLKRHFAGVEVAKLVTASREYSVASRVDLQRAVDELVPQFTSPRQLGLHAENVYETLTLSHLFANLHSPVVIGPLQYEEVDIGEILPAPCVRRALWLVKDGRHPFAVILGPASRFGQHSGTSLEIAVIPGEHGVGLTRRLFDAIDTRVKAAASYRGRVISLSADRYSSQVGVIRVHKLKQVEQGQLILPPTTVALLNRNVIGFVEQREQLKALGLPARKGLLFYGPPGTGKTHTVHYLASRLPQHTTLLVTAEEVALLDHYFQLARFLQPAILVIEDVDLIARARDHVHGPSNEILLNKLLNEMDGLREDAEVLFILTTNRPEQLEAALAGRPGRIDQAIEFPLPDDEGRRQLARLYAGGLDVSPPVLKKIVQRTQGASAALIKELMRRSAQFLLETGDAAIAVEHVNAALEEMLFQGGSLNAKLLGGVVA